VLQGLLLLLLLLQGLLPLLHKLLLLLLLLAAEWPAPAAAAHAPLARGCFPRPPTVVCQAWHADCL
jgi:hypothetical protein